MVEHALLPCDVVRQWPQEWTFSSLLREDAATSIFPAPSRFLHPALEVRSEPHRGVRLIAAKACCALELALVDAPCLTAPSTEALREAAQSCPCAESRGPELAQMPLADCAADKIEKIQSQTLEKALRRNMRVEATPRDGQTPSLSVSTTTCGVWPLASLLNHALHPNVTRFHIGHAVCYRFLRDVAAGEEIQESYLDPRLPRAEREKILRDQHGLGDDGTDESDVPATLILELDRLSRKADRFLKAQKPDKAFLALTKATNLCSESGCRSPIFASAFESFAEVAGCLGGGGPRLQIEGLVMALEHATIREAYSVWSCSLSVRILGIALETGSENDIPDDELRRLEELCREHVRHVFGSETGLFEALNPGIVKRLAAGDSASGEKPLESCGEATQTQTKKRLVDECSASEVEAASQDVAKKAKSTE